MLTLDVVRTLFAQIESGAVTVTPSEPPSDIFAGDVTYCTSNGWTIVVFNDCNSFDYIDHVISPDGERLDSFDEKYPSLDKETYEVLDELHLFVEAYRPPGNQASIVWQIADR